MSLPESIKLTGRRCQCGGCGAYFNGERGFDRHRVGTHGLNRRCLTGAELMVRGWHRNVAGFWATSYWDSASRARIRPSHTAPLRSPLLDGDALNSPGPAGAA